MNKREKQQINAISSNDIYALLGTGRVLQLALKNQWFDMIASGRKKEEYREVKDYWMKRIAGVDGCGSSYNFNIMSNRGNKCKEFDYIYFKNGYHKDALVMLLKCKGITVALGKRVWGAPNHRSFVIKLGCIIYHSAWASCA